MKRRAFLATALGAALSSASAARAEFAALPDLEAEARALASRPYAAPDPGLHPPFDALDYDSYRAIRPRPGGGAEIELGAGIRAQALPRGALHRRPVEIFAPGAAGPLPFRLRDFEFDPQVFPALPADSPPGRHEFSGLRFIGPFDRPADELAVFQGASYFRALARGTVYGLSARALALGTGGPAPEEFPAFTRLVLAPVENGAIRLGALVDSPRATAAFFARLRPGAPTVMDCRLVVFARQTLADAGIAPLTSMFHFGPMAPGIADDFRPAVHDSDVLWMRNGAGETLWRPLANPARLQMSAFADDRPRGFGLLQTQRRFGDFQDAEAEYHRRPHAWVEPQGDWGPGAVHLLEIPTRDEYADNIVAFWRPARPLAPGRAHRFAYRLVWSAAAPPARAPLIPIRSATGVSAAAPRARLFVIDFETAGGGGAPPGSSLRTLVTAGAGTVGGATVYALPQRGRLRASFVFTPAPGSEAAELRATLLGPGGEALAPVWLFRWTPPRDPSMP